VRQFAVTHGDTIDIEPASPKKARHTIQDTGLILHNSN
jgi:hypothetical protein